MSSSSRRPTTLRLRAREQDERTDGAAGKPHTRVELSRTEMGGAMQRSVLVLVTVACSFGAVLSAPRTAAAQVPAPTLEEVPYDVGIHGHPMWDPWFDIGAFGYEAYEYFVSGTATSADGTSTAPYTTRIIVVRPSDPADHSGTVVLDWVNVTSRFENAVNSLTSVRHFLREGWTWVHVSAQRAGLCCTPLTPKVYDPVRYEPIDHPGDEYANSMFSQIARAFAEPGEVDPMGGLEVEVLLAAGQSQSANRLTDYVQNAQPDAGIVDGFLIQAEGAKVYEEDPAAPVFHVLGEREGDPEEPTEWPNYILWEIAGSAHSDMWVGRQQTDGARQRLGGRPRLSREEAEDLWQVAGNMGEEIDPRQTACIVNGALFPTRYAVNAALDHLDRWVREDVRPPEAPRYRFDGDQVARDADGNALGGLRLAPIEVPIATYDSARCNLGGITIPFSETQLRDRYGDHQHYFDLVVAATAEDVAAGYILPDDAEELLARACAARPRFGEGAASDCVASVEGPSSGPGGGSDDGQPPAQDRPSGALPDTGGGAAAGGTALVLLGALGLRAAAGRGGRGGSRPRRASRSRD